jgi:hypothetical protein
MRKRVPTLVAGLLIGALFAGGAAIAVTSTSFKYSTTKTGYLAMSTMDFAPDSLSGATLDYFNGWNSNTLSNDESGRCFNAGVNLPNGAKIKSIRFFYQSDATSDFYGTLIRANPATGASSRIAEVVPANDADVRTSVSDNIPSTKQLVKNKTFQYAVGACPFDGTTFLGARITYTYTNAGD